MAVPEASLGAVVLVLLLAGLGAPIPEEAALLAGGVIAHRTGFPFWATLLVCAAGVLAGDFVLFTSARRLGPMALERRPFRTLLPPERRAKLEALFERRGGVIVFLARHIAGLRAPIFVLAGVHGMPRGRFFLYDGLGVCVTVPVVVGLGYFLSHYVDQVRHDLARIEEHVLIAAVALLLLYALGATVRRYVHRRRATT
jgi:membrane protein DedA with SNARE-associated domain